LIFGLGEREDGWYYQKSEKCVQFKILLIYRKQLLKEASLRNRGLKANWYVDWELLGTIITTKYCVLAYCNNTHF